RVRVGDVANIGLVLQAVGVFHLGGFQLVLPFEVGRGRDRVDRGAGIVINDEGDEAPGDHDDRHHRRGDHDLERLATGFVDAEEVLAEEIHGDGAGDEHRTNLAGGLFVLLGEVESRHEQLEQQQAEAHDVLPGGDAAGRPGEDVV